MKKRVSKVIDVGQELRNLGALIEHNNDNIGAIAELYGDINKKIDAHTDTLSSHTEMAGKLLVEVEVIKTNVEFVKSNLKKKVDYDEFIALERRVHMLEGKHK